LWFDYIFGAGPPARLYFFFFANQRRLFQQKVPMEQSLPTPTQQATVDQVYEYAANQLVHGQKSGYEVKQLLIGKGLDAESADIVVGNLETQIQGTRRKQAKKDMLYGALWCVGGLALTLANVGFIFWGAIIFGGVQFFKGVANLSAD
jgi:fructosamine-3-kinase